MNLRTVLVLLIFALVAYAIVQARRALAARRAGMDAVPLVIPEPGLHGENGEEGDKGGFHHAPRPAAPAEPEPPASMDGFFRLELELRQLRSDVARLQSEQAMQRQIIDDLVDSVRGLREQPETNLAAQGVSPEYGEALVLARRGLDAETIAGRCGITVAEAELVRSMTRRDSGQGDT